MSLNQRIYSKKEGGGRNHSISHIFVIYFFNPISL